MEAAAIAELRAQLARRERELDAVHRVTSALHACTGLERLIQEALRVAIETMEASAGSILLHDAVKDCLVFRYVIGERPAITRQLTGREMPAGEGIAGQVFQTGRGVITADVDADPAHYPEIDRQVRYDTQNLMAAPLKTSEGHTIGVLEVLNRRGGGFSRDDLEVLEILSSQAAAALETASLHEQVLQAEQESKSFLREVLLCVTQRKFHLVDAPAVPTLGEAVAEILLEEPDGYAFLRRRLRHVAEAAGMSPENADDLILAVGEAATNAIKHAVRACATLYAGSGRIAARITDRGKGIRAEDLPATILMPGFSTKVSLGMGYTLMLQLVDDIWLATGPDGTIVQVEKWIDPEQHREDPLAAVLARF
jgi:anti-sigma regulatory factor (Ser/Thr protein kinase)